MNEDVLAQLGLVFEECVHSSATEGSVDVAQVVEYLIQVCTESQDCEKVKDLLWEKLTNGGDRLFIDKNTFLSVVQGIDFGLSSDSAFVDVLDTDIGKHDQSSDNIGQSASSLKICNKPKSIGRKPSYEQYSDSTYSSEECGSYNAQDILELKLKVTKLVEENSRISTQLANAEDVNEALNNTNENLKAKLLQVKYQEEIAVVSQDEADVLRSEIENYLADISDLTSKVESLTSENTHLRNELRKTQTKLEVCEADQEKVMESALDLKTSLNQYKSDLSTTMHLKQQREKELSNAKHRVENLTDNLKDRDDQLKELCKENTSLRSQLLEANKLKAKFVSKMAPIYVNKAQECGGGDNAALSDLSENDLLLLDDKVIADNFHGWHKSLDWELKHVPKNLKAQGSVNERKMNLEALNLLHGNTTSKAVPNQPVSNYDGSNNQRLESLDLVQDNNFCSTPRKALPSRPFLRQNTSLVEISKIPDDSAVAMKKTMSQDGCQDVQHPLTDASSLVGHVSKNDGQNALPMLSMNRLKALFMTKPSFKLDMTSLKHHLVQVRQYLYKLLRNSNWPNLVLLGILVVMVFVLMALLFIKSDLKQVGPNSDLYVLKHQEPPPI